jgi:DNA-binding response OmpR family regulator
MNTSLDLVLVVENDAVQRDVMVMALKRLGCEVISASTAARGLELVEENHPSIVLIDVYLPQVNGFEMLQRMQRGKEFAETTVIMISSMGFSEVVKKAIDLGARGFLVKPVDIDLLIERVNYYRHSSK